MSIELVIIFSIVSICLGILPVLLITFRKFGIKKQLCLSWMLGGAFWGLALLARTPLLILIQLYIKDFNLTILLAATLAGIFETLFRVILILFLTKRVADSKDKLLMAGLGWGTIEAIVVHTIPVLLIMIAPSNELLIILEGYEWTLIFGGFERIIVEFFHLAMIILVFYGLKHRLRNIEQSRPIAETFFTKDPKPIWLWIIIVILLHFSFDFIIVSLAYSVGLVFTYMVGIVFVGIIISFISNRVRAYPLFPKKE